MNNFWRKLKQPFFILAPMEAVTDVVFRRVVARAGAPDIWFSEFTNATGWVHAGQKAIGTRLLKTDDENPIVAQIWGGEPGDMEQLAAHCRELGFHGIDINMGCPAKSAIKSGGAALIRNPKLAASAIAAAKTAGLPVSVKTRLGYTHLDEWRDWLAHLLRQDIVNLTIHLRTKKEMSKVPAHFELIPEIIKLRDEIAPKTLLTINGDIQDRAHGLELIKKHPGVNGIMIGRGVFQDPFCFSVSSSFSASSSATTISRTPPFTPGSAPKGGARATVALRDALRGYSAELSSGNLSDALELSTISSSEEDGMVMGEHDEVERPAHQPSIRDAGLVTSGARDMRRGEDGWGDGRSEKVTSVGGVGREMVEGMGEQNNNETSRRNQLIDLLNYHLDLFDHYQPQTNRPFETLKRFFKIYIRDFDGAKELRDKLMQTKSTEEVRKLTGS